jgi:hypothetical protein
MTLAAEIVTRVCNGQLFSHAMVADLSSDPDFKAGLREAIEVQALQKNWGCLLRLIWVLERFPDKDLVPLLSNLLDARENDIYMEEVVDALNIMLDERAVGALKRAMSYRMPGDDLSFHFNMKVLSALTRIGSDEAMAVVSEALQSPEEPIRAFAKEILNETS